MTTTTSSWSRRPLWRLGAGALAPLFAFNSDAVARGGFGGGVLGGGGRGPVR